MQFFTGQNLVDKCTSPAEVTSMRYTLAGLSNGRHDRGSRKAGLRKLVLVVEHAIWNGRQFG